jgi:DNA invertase Pin-like site-specific DNA recombinase
MTHEQAAIYLRVSTEGQTVDNQRPELEQLARQRDLIIRATYAESASATKRRPVFERMMADARRGTFDVLLVWSLDRFGRSMAGNVNDALALDRVGVKLLSVREPWLDTGGPVRDLLLAIFSWVAEQEVRRLIERTRAGIERARVTGTRSGRPIGRPRRLGGVDLERVRRMHKQGFAVSAIAAALRLPRSTLVRALGQG